MLEILEHEGLLDLCIERSLLSGMQLDRVGASIASFDLLYLPELRRRGFVAPSVDAARASAGVSGGALLDPVPGFHRDVAVFDFKSLYPSLIRTFDLDPLAHALAPRRAKRPARASQADDALEAPNGARFARSGGILPGVVERFWEARAAARERGDAHAAQAIKIMLNALFGVLGATACRFFDADVANAITGFGQQTLRWTRDAFAEQGVRVLYGDTDSVFVEVSGSRRGGAAARARRGAHRAAHRARVPGGVAPRTRVRPLLRSLLPAAGARRARRVAQALRGLGGRRSWSSSGSKRCGATGRPSPRGSSRACSSALFTDGRWRRSCARSPRRCSRASATPNSSTRSACARRRSTATPRPRRPTCRPRASWPSRACGSGRSCAT